MTDLLGTREAAVLLGVSEASVRRWSDAGLLPVQRLGRRRERRFREADLRGFSQAGWSRAGSRAAAPEPPVAQAWRGVRAGFAALPRNTHVAGFYASEAGRLRLAVPFLREGLDAGEPCFLVASDGVRDGYLAALRSSGADLERALGNGLLITLRSLGGTAQRALDRWEHLLWSALTGRAPAARIVSDVTSLRANFRGAGELLELEAGLDLLVRRFPAVILCQYDVRDFSGEAILAALKAHPDLFRAYLGDFLT